MYPIQSVFCVMPTTLRSGPDLELNGSALIPGLETPSGLCTCHTVFSIVLKNRIFLQWITKKRMYKTTE